VRFLGKISVALAAFGLVSTVGVSAQTDSAQKDSTRRYTLQDTLAIEACVVTARADIVTVEGDTLVYNPQAFFVPEDAMLEDLLRKIPGLEIDGGTVMLQGKEISQLYIDGKRFFGGNVMLGLKSLSADMVEKINAYERESDFTRISGIDDGEKEPVLDIKIKESKLKGWHNRLAGGYGTQGRYLGRFNANKITKETQQTIVLSQNNISSLAGLNTTSRNQVGTGSAGNRTSREAGWSFGKNTKKLELNGALHYDGFDRNADSRSRVENINQTSISYTNANAGVHNMANNANGNFTLEWRPTKRDVLYVKPEFKYNGKGNATVNQSSYFTKNPYNYVDDPNDWLGFDIPDDPLKTVRSNSQDNITHNYNNSFQGALVVNGSHKFEKKGRSLSFRVKGDYTTYGEEQFNSYLTRYYKIKKNPDSLRHRNMYVNTGNTTFAFQGQVAYSEPLGGGFMIQTTLRGEKNVKTSDRGYYSLAKVDPSWRPDSTYGRNAVYASLPSGWEKGFDPGLSSVGRYEYTAASLICNLRYVKKKLNILAGVTLRPYWTALKYEQEGVEKEQLDKGFQVAPNIHVKWNRSKRKQLSFVYNNWASLPTMYELIDVDNGTNPQYVHRGNPDLKPGLVHNMNLSYNLSNLKDQSSLIINGFLRINQGKSTSLATYDPVTGVRTSTPVNVDGNWKTNGSIVFNKAFRGGIFSLSNSFSGEYQNNVSYLYSSSTRTSDLNVANRTMLKDYFEGRMMLPWLEMNLQLRGEYTIEKSLLRPEMDQQPLNVSAGLSSEFHLPWKMRVAADYTFMIQRGYSYEELNRNYHILNAYVAQPLLRGRLTLKLEGHDLLDQLQNLTRTFGAQSRSVVMYNGVTSFILLRATWKFETK